MKLVDEVGRIEMHFMENMYAFRYTYRHTVCHISFRFIGKWKYSNNFTEKCINVSIKCTKKKQQQKQNNYKMRRQCITKYVIKLLEEKKTIIET